MTCLKNLVTIEWSRSETPEFAVIWCQHLEGSCFHEKRSNLMFCFWRRGVERRKRRQKLVQEKIGWGQVSPSGLRARQNGQRPFWEWWCAFFSEYIAEMNMLFTFLPPKVFITSCLFTAVLWKQVYLFLLLCIFFTCLFCSYFKWSNLQKKWQYEMLEVWWE